MGVCAFLYGAIAILGYFWSMEETCGNILLNFDTKDIPMTIGRVALGLTVCLSFPLLVLPCRATLHNIIGTTFPDLFLPEIDEYDGEEKDSSADFLSRSVSLYDSPL